jgi:hypothetical protein
MGAAFVVALVLIYILVVWEFGNFRIPLVIMAPIPLTLLGIIPAHFVMFQLGLGGEFTATSMIGWIALAGIIVRNSILLVDFSIHEVQKGVPVAEAVIRACKTRTRPILITALALVAGSSVIFTDPIFQGMAISLASGVLVSTVLTLIVIPLGCVAASKDLCEVAVATAPAGVNVPCAAEEAERAAGEERAAADRPSRLAGAFGRVVEGLTMVFYLIRGIFLLLFDLVKNLIKKKRQPPKPPPRPAGGPGGSSGPGSPPASGAPPSVGGGTAAPAAPSPQGASPAPAAARAAAPAEPAQGAGSVAPAAAVVTPAPARAEPLPAAPEPAAQAPAVPEPAAQPAAAPAPKQAAKAPAAERPEPTPPPGDGGEAKAKAPRKAAAKKVAGRKSAAQKTAKPEPAQATLLQKKAPRRGIRLKVDGGQGPGFD